MRVIGLTGGIGAGKTEVAKTLEALGAAIINADLLGHEVYRPRTEGWGEIVEEFGDGILTSSEEVDRRRLAEIVFNDPAALRRLNEIVHPRIYTMIEERIENLSQKGQKVAVVEAALLVEANWIPLVDEVWAVTTAEQEAIRRLLVSRQMNEEAVRARIRSQIPREDRIQNADVVIDNRGDLADLKQRVRGLWNKRLSAHKEDRLST